MSQRPIREYDAKKMFADYADRPYIGFLVTNEEEINSLPAWLEKEQVDTRVVKPDQLFGKRSKLGLVGVKLDASGIQQWIQTHREQEITIDGVKDTLHTFLIEPFVPHTEEYYLSFATKREEDTIRFSARGGVDIEEQRETVKTVGVPVLDELEDHHLEELLEKGKQKNEKIMKGLIKNLFSFFRSYGFTSLEINPFCFDETGGLHLLDMVASVDTCETYRQAKNWKILKRVKPFGAVQHLAEKKIEELDEKTGASLKLTIINPDGRLWFLLGGGGASVIVMDTLAEQHLLDELANYGELSGNPDEESNRIYVQTIVETMLANGQSDQYLCLVGGIANFTDILDLVKPFTGLLENYADQLRERRVTILMRRGGLRVELAMQLLETTCKKLGLLHKILDDEHILTEILQEIKI